MSITLPRAVRVPAPRASAAAIAVPAALALAAGLWDLSGPPLWRDEAATVSAASRTLPEMARLLQSVDAVHGLYYALMHVVVTLFGTDIVVLRLPSVVAGMLAAAGVGALGRALGNARAGLYGGVLLALMPVFSRYVQEARPYALTMAATIGTTLLFLRALRAPGFPAFASYGMALVGVAYLNLFAVLVVGAHGISVLLCRGPFIRWCAAAVPALAAVAPLAWLGSRQSAQVGWIARPDAGDAGMLAVQLFGDLGAMAPAWLGVAPLAGALVVMGAAMGLVGGAVVVARLNGGTACAVETRPLGRGATPGWGAKMLTRVALPWLLVPPVVLLTASLTAHPVYVFRYVLCCVPAAALLAGAGLAALPGRVAVALLLAACGLSVPGQLVTRGPDGRQDDPGPVMALLASESRSGDGVMFLPRKVRKYVVVYPGLFGRLDDVALARSPQYDGSYAGREVGPRDLNGRLAGLRTLWVVGYTRKIDVPNRRLDLVHHSFVSTGSWRSRGLFVTRYEADVPQGSSNGAGVGK
jgi:mannosyltransferase